MVKSIEIKAKEFFANPANEGINELHSTTDGRLWLNAAAAGDWAKRQGQKKGAVYSRDSLAKAEAKAQAAKKAPEVKKPTEKMTKDQLADWLNEQDVEFDLDDVKAVLLEKATTKYEDLTENKE